MLIAVLTPRCHTPPSPSHARLCLPRPHLSLACSLAPRPSAGACSAQSSRTLSGPGWKEEHRDNPSWQQSIGGSAAYFRPAGDCARSPLRGKHQVGTLGTCGIRRTRRVQLGWHKNAHASGAGRASAARPGRCLLHSSVCHDASFGLQIWALLRVAASQAIVVLPVSSNRGLGAVLAFMLRILQNRVSLKAASYGRVPGPLPHGPDPVMWQGMAPHSDETALPVRAQPEGHSSPGLWGLPSARHIQHDRGLVSTR